ncbi:MAG: hypothetical protein F7B61_07000 [Caldisphaeraceae archaeon]|nr:hypothetical protein [Caldisphaeraceae archaeon]
MDRKYQDLKVTEASLIISLLYRLITALEDTYDDAYDLFNASINANDITPIDMIAKKREIRVGVNAPWDFENVEEEIDNRKLKIVKERYARNHVSIEKVYSLIPLIPYKYDINIIKEFARKTTSTGIEYLLLYDENSNLTILEGELFRVRLPFVKVIYNMHTHPLGHCGLSQPDVNSGLDLLSEGGISSSASTENCAVIMHRVGLVLEDDYIKIKSSKGKVGGNLTSIKFSKIIY